MTTKQARPRLSLPGVNGPATPPPAPAEEKQAAKPKPAPTNDIREFQMLDGRPIGIHRLSVTFAAPNKDAPDKETIVGLRHAKAVPLRVNHASFMQWWWKK